MRIRQLAAVVALLCVACDRAAPPSAKAPARGPLIRAAVITIRTTIEPERRTYDHTIMVARGKARSSAERDVWRLFDLNASTVTVVDDLDRKVRTDPFETLRAKRREATAVKPAPFIPSLSFKEAEERRTLLGVPAERVVIEAGAYRRELWIARHPAIPEALFAMMHLTETPTSPLAGMMREVDDRIASLKGFPLLDRTEVPIGDGKTVITRAVMNVTERDVPEATFTVPAGYTRENAER